MPHLKLTDQLPVEHVPAVCQAMLTGFQAFYQREEKRARHFYNDDSVDPQLGEQKGGRPDPDSPFAHVSRYQTDRLRQENGKWVDRVAENHLTIEVKPPRNASADQRDLAEKMAAVWNDWFLSVEERTGMLIQERAAQGQCKRPYAILHSRRVEDLWPEIDRLVTDTLPKDSTRAAYETRKRDVEQETECPECEGEGTRSEEGVELRCEACEGSGMVKTTARVYRERGDVYEKRVQEAYAEAGSPWHDEFIDFMQFVPAFDNHPVGGLFRGLLHYEVSLADYRAAGHNGPVDMAHLRAAQKAPGGTHGPVPFETEMSADLDQRVTVYQLWTRSHCYEWADGDVEGNGDRQIVREWKHGYRGVPFWLIPFRDHGDPDPMRRFECALEGMYRFKEWSDRAWTITGAVVEGQAAPLTTRQLDPDTAPLLSDPGPDGNPAGGEGTAAGRNEAFAGDVKVISFPMPQSIPQWLELSEQEMDRRAPETGRADIDKNTAPWTARQALAQANIGPMRAIAYQKLIFDDNLAFKAEYHIDGDQPLIGLHRDDEGHREGGDPIVIEGGQLRGFKPVVRIAPESEMERITAVEHTISVVERGFGLEEDVYEAQGYEDPAQRALEVAVSKVIQPLKQARIAQRVAAVMGSEFLLGPNGEFIGPGGMGVPPEQVAAQNGIQPGASNPLSRPVSPIANSAGGQTTIGALPTLAADPVAGLPAKAGVPG